MQTMVQKPVVIDTDMANDDWMAILYLLQCPAVEVTGITVAASGEAHRGPGVRNALRLLELAQAPAVPVAGGRKTPLRGKHKFPLIWRLSMDARLGLSLPRSKRKPSGQNAVELLTSLIKDARDKVTIVALGPLTNLAEAFLADPSLAGKVGMIYIMGGAVDVPGNLQAPGVKIDNQVAEWNIYVDPYAAAAVFEAGPPVTLVPLDATNRVPVTMDFYHKCLANHHTPAADFVFRILKRLKSFIKSGEFYFWDPLAAVIAVNETIAAFQERHLIVAQAEGAECGRTLAADGGVPIRVCVSADQAQFEKIFLDTLNNLHHG